MAIDSQVGSSQSRPADYRLRMGEKDEKMGTPNCPVYLARIWPSGSEEKPYRYCPTCKLDGYLTLWPIRGSCSHSPAPAPTLASSHVPRGVREACDSQTTTHESRPLNDGWF